MAQGRVAEILKKSAFKLTNKTLRIWKQLVYLSLSIYDRSPGSAWWLNERENHYGGFTTGVSRRLVSPFDSRSCDQISAGGMTGGDRMSPFFHNYASFYAKHFRRFKNHAEIVLVEVGILRGTGLAIWCDLFPQGTIIGLDIDLSHFKENLPSLKEKGAFSGKTPTVFEFDQLCPNTLALTEFLRDKKIDIVIDDGLHTADSVYKTFIALRPLMSDNSIYIVEDFMFTDSLKEKIQDLYSLKTSGVISVIQC